MDRKRVSAICAEEWNGMENECLEDEADDLRRCESEPSRCAVCGSECDVSATDCEYCDTMSDKANEHGLRLCMVRLGCTSMARLERAKWEWAWVHEWTQDEDMYLEAIIETSEGHITTVSMADIRFPSTPALPKHAPPEVE